MRLSLAVPTEAIGTCSETETKERISHGAEGKGKSADQTLYHVEILDKLIANYPREVQPANELIEFALRSAPRVLSPSVLASVQDRFKALFPAMWFGTIKLGC